MAYFPGDVDEVEIVQFQGSAQASDPYSLDSAHGLYSQNVDFVIGPDGAVQAQSRLGASQIAQIPSADAGGVAAMAGWYYVNGGNEISYAIYYCPTSGNVQFWSQFTSTFFLVMTYSGAAGAQFALNGIKALIAFTNANGKISSSQGYITDGNTPSNTDPLFPPPMQLGSGAGQITITTNLTGTGVVTAGSHRIGFQYTSRNGYVSALNPVGSNGVFAPVLVTGSDGAHSIQVSVTWGSSIPAYLQGGSIAIVMTTASNLSRYYLVPGASGLVATPGFPTIITVNITDGDLAATGTDATQAQNLLVTSQTGTPPFKPHSVFVYSSRAGYCTYDLSGFPVLYFSDQNSFQSLTAAFHGIYLEARQIPVQGASLGAICYIATVSGLYNCQDNGGYPATWTPPARVDGSVGINAPTCMIAAGGKLVIASEKGMYIYRGGAFPVIPNSYWQSPDWDRINWGAPTQVQIVDDSYRRVLRVIAPLKVVITAATNTSPIQITTGIIIGKKPIAYPHLFQTGLSVTISGVTGNTNANGTFAATVTGANTFTIPIAGNGSYAPTTAPYASAVPGSQNAEMSWNYSKSEQPGEMFYSLNAFTSYLQGAVAIVRNTSNNIDEPWYAPHGQGGIIRRALPTDSTPNRDVDMSGNPAAINSNYETGIAPGTDQRATVHDFHGAHFRISGHGTLGMNVYGLDHVRSLVPTASPLPLLATPGLEVLVKWFLRSEQQTISFGTNAVDAYFVAALVRAYYAPSLPFR